MKYKRLHSLTIAGVLVVSAALVTSSARAAKIAVGDRVPDFQIKDHSGKTQTLSSYTRDGTVVLMVIATRCPYSRAFDQVMAALPEKYRGKKILFVGINANRTEPADEVLRHAKANRFTFPVLKDPGQRVVDSLGAQVTPEIFVVDRRQRLIYHGAIGNSRKPTRDSSVTNDKDLSAALMAHLQGRTIKRPSTKAFGCTIKR